MKINIRATFTSLKKIATCGVFQELPLPLPQTSPHNFCIVSPIQLKVCLFENKDDCYNVNRADSRPRPKQTNTNSWEGQYLIQNFLYQSESLLFGLWEVETKSFLIEKNNSLNQKNYSLNIFSDVTMTMICSQLGESCLVNPALILPHSSSSVIMEIESLPQH